MSINTEVRIYSNKKLTLDQMARFIASVEKIIPSKVFEVTEYPSIHSDGTVDAVAFGRYVGQKKIERIRTAARVATK